MYGVDQFDKRSKCVYRLKEILVIMKSDQNIPGCISDKTSELPPTELRSHY